MGFNKNIFCRELFGPFRQTCFHQGNGFKAVSFDLSAGNSGYRFGNCRFFRGVIDGFFRLGLGIDQDDNNSLRDTARHANNVLNTAAEGNIIN